MNNTVKVAIGILLAIVLGYGVGRLSAPEKLVEVEKEVIKERRDVVTVYKEVKRPDGTVEKESTTVDKSQYDSARESSKTVETRSQWLVSAIAFKDNKYGAKVDRRIVGNIFLGLYADVDKNRNTNVGAGVTLEF